MADGRYAYGLPVDLTEVARPDGSMGPWHPGFDLYELTNLATTLRNAAFVLVAALSVMRDSELQEIARGSVVEHYSAPAVASTLVKGRTGRPRKHWWISEPVAEAITVAESVSPHAHRVFTTMTPGAVNDELDGGDMVDSFIALVNAQSAWSGLEAIPKGTVRPHMFRRTMAMRTDQSPVPRSPWACSSSTSPPALWPTGPPADTRPLTRLGRSISKTLSTPPGSAA
ncbi:hypothetical protein ACFWC9_29245 [Streptomyces goshikiensis]|uniref:hypothetical protein n=1 Tax=Streptomyces goshikiensis TaxID=1942 RepID=UPI00368A5D32